MTTQARSPGRPPVPLHRIIASAIALLDEEGCDALSMRALAQRLGSGTATLYRHFAGRADLIACVVDEVMGEATNSPKLLSGLPWQQAIEIAAQDMFDVLRTHPNVAPLIVERVPVGPNALALREGALSLLLDAGFSPPLAARAWATLARFVLGFASQVGTGPDDAARPAAWADVDISEFPATVVVADHVPVSLEVEFTFGLRMLLAGLAQMHAEARTLI